jgi:hypothetical protein
MINLSGKYRPAESDIRVTALDFKKTLWRKSGFASGLKTGAKYNRTFLKVK